MNLGNPLEHITGYLTRLGGLDSVRQWIAGPGAVITYNHDALNPEGRQFAEWALDAWNNVTGFIFKYAAEDANITYDHADDGDDNSVASAAVNFDGSFITSATISVPKDAIARNGTTIDSYTMTVFIHETGHALGLGHPASYDGGTASFASHAESPHESWQTSVMSYVGQDENPFIDASRAYPVTPMIADIEAIHEIYYAPKFVAHGDTFYGAAPATGSDYLDALFSVIYDAGANGQRIEVAFTLHDTGGHDAISFESSSFAQRIDLTPGGISDIGGLRGNMVLTADTLIEDAIGGTGYDLIIGNIADNKIYGGLGGDDEIWGMGGSDTLAGNPDDNKLYGGPGHDILYTGGGNDTLTGGVGWDEFRIAAQPGTIRIMDFEKCCDTIDLRLIDGLTFEDLDYTIREHEDEESFLGVTGFKDSGVIDLTEYGGPEVILVDYTDDLTAADVLIA